MSDEPKTEAKTTKKQPRVTMRVRIKPVDMRRVERAVRVFAAELLGAGLPEENLAIEWTGSGVNVVVE